MKTPPATPDAAPARNHALDVLRGVAVLLVISHHLRPPTTLTPPGLRFLFAALYHGGWIGVDIFFVLSGFLVSGLLFREYRTHGRVRPLRFLVRRGFKIYPAFYALLLFTVLAPPPLRPQLSGRGLLGEILFLQNYIGPVWGHTWSLAVEEHFYALLSVLFLLLHRVRGPRAFIGLTWIVVGVAVAALGLRLHSCLATLSSPLCAQHGYCRFMTHFATHLRIDSLFFGVLLGYYHHFHEPALRRWVWRWRRGLLPASLALLAVAFLRYPTDFDFFLNSFGYTALYLGSGGLLLAGLYPASPAPVAEGSHEKPGRGGLATIGLYSYSIYLWHNVVLGCFTPTWFEEEQPGWGYLSYAAVCLCGSVALGWLTARIVELPALRLRDRLVSR